MRVAGLFVTAVIMFASFGVHAEPKDAPAAEKLSDEPDTSSWRLPPITLQWENDMFAGTDRHYTNGFRATAVFSKRDTPKTIEDFLQSLSHFDDDKQQPHWLTVGIGQDMFTPIDKKTTTLISDDRPYAGWLYLSFAAHKLSTCVTSSNDNPDCLDSVEANIGVVGPAALAKQTQDFVHSARNITRFEGWNNQLQNEPGFVMSWERRKRWIAPPDKAWGYDLIPNIGASLGNVLTQVNAGISLRVGYNIANDFGAPSAIKPVASAPISSMQEDRWGGYFFIGAEGRYVAHNIFLDGNTIANSHSVSKKPWVYDLPQGIAITQGPYRLSIARVFRSREFKSQKQNTHFSSVTLTVKF